MTNLEKKMNEMILSEVEEAINGHTTKIELTNYDHAKIMAKQLVTLATGTRDGEDLSNSYIAMVKNICSH